MRVERGVDAGVGEALGVDSGSGLRAFQGCDLLCDFKKPPVCASGSRDC